VVAPRLAGAGMKRAPENALMGGFWAGDRQRGGADLLRNQKECQISQSPLKPGGWPDLASAAQLRVGVIRAPRIRKIAEGA